MKIRLISGDTYSVSRAEITNGRLEIDFKDKSCEEIQELFSVPANLARIETLTDNDEKYGELSGWTVYSGVMMLEDTKTLILTKSIDAAEQRLTAAEAKALAASVLAETVKKQSDDTASQVTDLQMALCEIFEGMGA